MDWNVWGAPFVVLAVGMVVGLVLALQSRGTARRRSADEAWALKESLVDQLRSLRADQDKMPDGVFDERFARLLDSAAQALKDAEEAETEPEPLPAPPPRPTQPVSWARRAGWGVATLLFFTAVGFALRGATSDRSGGSMTGGDRIGPTAISKRLKQLKAAHEEDPQAIAPINELTHIALQQSDFGGAMAWIDKARAIAPDHPEVRTHLAILQASIGMNNRAKAELEAALEGDPTLSKAHLWLGLLALRAGDRAEAVVSLEAALEHAANGEDRTMASRALGEARRPPAVTKLRGSLAFAPGVTAPSGGALFVIARTDPTGGGPPVAAVRLDPRGVPGSFSMTDRDIMMGGPWPEQVWVEARIDGDGDPTTRSPDDLTALPAGPFSPGAEGANLVLQGPKTQASSTTEGVMTDDDGPQVSGLIEISEGTILPETGAVFVIVRRTDSSAGPPVAAVRMDRSEIPGPFSVSNSDIMMGGPWPAQVWIQVRVDGDGNAMTKDPSDVSSALEGPFSAGSESVVISLSN